MVFVIDTSGSMAGRPLEQAVDAVERALEHLTPERTFQILNFSDTVSRLGAEPVPATPETTVRRAALLRNLVAERRRHADAERHSRGARLPARSASAPRFVTFLTDGYIGNEVEIFGEVHRLIGAARIFSFGVGNAVNRYLLDGLATEGPRRGRVPRARRLRARGHARSSSTASAIPALTDLAIDWRGLRATRRVSRALPDFSSAGPWSSRAIPREPPTTSRFGARAAREDVELRIATTGASGSRVSRSAISGRGSGSRISRAGRQLGAASPELAATIRETALEYSLMSAVHVVHRGRRERAHGRRTRHDRPPSRARAGRRTVRHVGCGALRQAHPNGLRSNGRSVRRRPQAFGATPFKRSAGSRSSARIRSRTVGHSSRGKRRCSRFSNSSRTPSLTIRPTPRRVSVYSSSSR